MGRREFMGSLLKVIQLLSKLRMMERTVLDILSNVARFGKYLKLAWGSPVVVFTFGLRMVCLILNILDSIQRLGHDLNLLLKKFFNSYT